MRKILFACTGNTCRSPMAEALFNKKIKENDILKDKYIAKSVGVFADIEYGKASDGAINALRSLYEIDLTSHIPNQATDKEIKESDLILCMSDSHVQFLKYNYENIGNNKIYLLKDYIGKNGNVLDPYGGNDDIYINCAKEINLLIDLLIKKLIEEEDIS